MLKKKKFKLSMLWHQLMIKNDSFTSVTPSLLKDVNTK
jgi:hypothetical protein